MDLIQKACNLGFILNNKEYYLWELQKWLREVHNIDVYCIPCESDYKEGQWFNNIASHNPPFTGTYEEALELGLIEGLKLIK